MQGWISHSTRFRSFWSQSSQPDTWLVLVTKSNSNQATTQKNLNNDNKDTNISKQN